MTGAGKSENDFVSRIARGATHEIRNVLATIKESAGVIKDMMALMEQGRPLEPDRVGRVLGRIDAQVGRGVELISSLNRFAHSLDQTRTSVELNQLVVHSAVLCRHSVKRAGHTLAVEVPDGELKVVLDALLFQMALFTAVQSCAASLAARGTITIRTGREENSGPAWVALTCEGADGAGSQIPVQGGEWGDLTVILGRMDASVESDPDRCRLTIFLPVS